MSRESCRDGAIISWNGQPKRTTGAEGPCDPPADAAHGRETAVFLALVKVLAQEAARDAFKAATSDLDKKRLV